MTSISEPCCLLWKWGKLGLWSGTPEMGLFPPQTVSLGCPRACLQDRASPCHKEHEKEGEMGIY